MIKKHKLTTEEFIERAKKIHENKYNYSQTIYSGIFKNVKIICPTHGEFFQEAKSHLKGRGCISCANKKPLTTEIFIKRAKDLYGEKYDYSKTNFISRRNFVTIICPTHGEFIQRADSHLTGRGCSKCAGFGRTKEEYIFEAKKIHGDKYDYSEMGYSPQLRKVEIICKRHGKFKIGKTLHILYKQGCPICSEPYGERIIRTFLEKNNINFIKEKTFSDCKNERLLQFDFYISSSNICIEFDGIQHFKILDFFGGKKAFIARIKNDKIKNEYCLKKGIPLYRIHYESNINKELEKIFF